jgi:hypothetical protein
VPVAQTNPRRAILLGLAAIVFAAGLLAIVLVANGTGGGGGGSFDAADAEELVRLQARDGVPALFPDPVGGRQPIFVWHEGNDPDEGWVAYDAQIDGEPLVLDRDAGVLRAEDGTEYPFTGEGLPSYDVEVVDGRLSIDLAGEGDDEPVTTTTRSG